MKRITAITLFAFASILGAGAAVAQDRGVQANVPFDFTVGNKLLPAGTYTITPASEGVIAIQNRDKHVLILSAALPDGKEAKNGGELVFDRYADQYFLREILCDAAAMNVELPATKAEKQARMQEAKVQNASQVEVAAR
jgi:hypothetical protein